MCMFLVVSKGLSTVQIEQKEAIAVNICHVQCGRVGVRACANTPRLLWPICHHFPLSIPQLLLLFLRQVPQSKTSFKNSAKMVTLPNRAQLL